MYVLEKCRHPNQKYRHANQKCGHQAKCRHWQPVSRKINILAIVQQKCRRAHIPLEEHSYNKKQKNALSPREKKCRHDSIFNNAVMPSHPSSEKIPSWSKNAVTSGPRGKNAVTVAQRDCIFFLPSRIVIAFFPGMVGGD